MSDFNQHAMNITPHTPSVRAQLVARRTYQRPLNVEGTVFETWEQTTDRVISHQRWLWERALGEKLNAEQEAELASLRYLIVNRAAFLSGRTMWLGGTDVSRRREASMTNCSFLRVETVYDVVDAFWLLLQGAGVGFEPVVGSLNGFARPLTVETVRSARKLNDGRVGREHNLESVRDGIWTISIGDSAEAWAKSVGKILAGKAKAHTLVLDFSEIRAAGSRLGGYGWISSGDGPLHEAMLKIAALLNRRVDRLLTKIDILDLMNLLGTTLSSRRSAQIALMPAGDVEADEFAMAKKDCFTNGLHHRGQSNNSVMFNTKPSVAELRGMFATMVDAGGSEPGFINMEAGKKRAPWMAGVNPCAEELLANKGVCNLSELVLTRFPNITDAAEAIKILARANYRQTCVNFDDGILQRSWHEVNDHLHLCGVGLTGISQWLGSLTEDDEPCEQLDYLADTARTAARGMARELGMPSPKHVTTTKPSGTLSKVADCSEGVHDALGEFVVNTIMLSAHDPLVGQLRAANYRVRPHPQLSESMLVEVPIHFPGATGRPASAIEQLERYKMMMQSYVDSNCSITVSYDQTEVRDICAWLYENWDTYVGVSFMPRIDATKTAEELGYSYLPQAVVTREMFDAYASTLLPIDLDAVEGSDLLGDDCAGGACPVR
jgi:adenosylcobalamin-dependent ribonucleoside-triphosphate reductase